MNRRNVFSIIFGTIIIYLVLIIALYPRNGCMKEFYKLKEDSVDVLFLGSSNAYTNINPAIIYEDTGIRSYLLGGSGQPLWNSYHYLVEAYKTQKPQIVVLEIFESYGLDYGYDELSNVPSDIFSMRPSMNQIELMETAVSKENRNDLILGLPIFHNRWERIIDGKQPWKYGNENSAIQKGHIPVFFSEKIETPVYNAQIRETIPAKNEEYLRKIIELAQDNGSQVVLIKTPYSLSEHHDGVYNSVKDIASEYKIDFINYNEIYNDLSFDYNTDMADIVHLNNVGSMKLSKHLGAYLMNKVESDRESSDSDWTQYLAEYNRTRFMSSDYENERLLAEYKNIELNRESENFYIWNSQLDFEKNSTYKIEVLGKSDEHSTITADIFGENYDRVQQKRIIYLEKGAEFVLIDTDDDIPKSSYLRLYSGCPRCCEWIRVYKVE